MCSKAKIRKSETVNWKLHGSHVATPFAFLSKGEKNAVADATAEIESKKKPYTWILHHNTILFFCQSLHTKLKQKKKIEWKKSVKNQGTNLEKKRIVHCKLSTLFDFTWFNRRFARNKFEKNYKYCIFYSLCTHALTTRDFTWVMTRNQFVWPLISFNSFDITFIQLLICSFFFSLSLLHSPRHR